MKRIFSKSYLKLASDFKTQPGSFPSGNYTMHDVLMNGAKPSKKRCRKCRRGKKGLDGSNENVTEINYQTGIVTPILETRTTGML
jgi:hypothetical protein